MDDKEFLRTRYSALIHTWTHHNSTQLQWPAAVLGGAVLILSSILPANLSSVTNTSLWGQNQTLQLEVGLPLIVLGIWMILMLYVMRRARRIMLTLGQAIGEIEEKSGWSGMSFAQLNLRSGVSG